MEYIYIYICTEHFLRVQYFFEGTIIYHFFQGPINFFNDETNFHMWLFQAFKFKIKFHDFSKFSRIVKILYVFMPNVKEWLTIPV